MANKFKTIAGAAVVESITTFTTIQNDDFLQRKQYQPLRSKSKEIRLLRFANEPGDGMHLELLSDPLSLLAPTTQYEALSYTAGNLAKLQFIYVNGISFKITSMLHAALEKLKSLPGAWDRWLWIDQICINQSDLSEKSSQVLMMGEIYLKASRTLICLNEEDLDRACQLVDHIERQAMHLPKPLPRMFVDLSDKGTRLFNRPIIDEFFFTQLSQIVESVNFEDCVDGLVRIVQSAWWTRCWCQQEAVMSKEPIFLAGGQSISWSTLFRVLDMLFVYNNHAASETIQHSRKDKLRFLVNSPGWLRASDLLDVRLHWQDNGGLGLGYLLRYSRRLQSTDPRDRVYAFLGMTDSEHHIVPDYNQDIGLGQVTTLAVKEILLEQQTIQFVVDAMSEELGLRESSSLPSWVPDIAAPDDPECLYIDFVDSTSGMVPYLEIRSIEDDDCILDILAVKAIQIDSPLDHRTIYTGLEQMQAPPEHIILAWWEFILHVVNPFDDQSSNATGNNSGSLPAMVVDRTQLLEHFCRTLAFGYEADYAILFDSLASGQGPATSERLASMRAATSKRLRLRSLPRRWTICYLGEKQVPCIITIEARPDDVIFLVPGVNIPVVLRKRPNDDNGYTFVGRAFIASYMDGTRAAREIESGLLDYKMIDLY